MINDHCLMYKKADSLGFGQMQEFPKTSDQLEFFFLALYFSQIFVSISFLFFPFIQKTINLHIEVTLNIYMDQTSRRSSYLAFVPVLLACSSCLPFPFTAIVGEEGILSMMDVRGESSSSSSSSLVYPFLCTTDTFLANADISPDSATFSATSAEEGGL